MPITYVAKIVEDILRDQNEKEISSENENYSAGKSIFKILYIIYFFLYMTQLKKNNVKIIQT